MKIERVYIQVNRKIKDLFVNLIFLNFLIISSMTCKSSSHKNDSLGILVSLALITDAVKLELSLNEDLFSLKAMFVTEEKNSEIITRKLHVVDASNITRELTFFEKNNDEAYFANIQSAWNSTNFILVSFDREENIPCYSIIVNKSYGEISCLSDEHIDLDPIPDEYKGISLPLTMPSIQTNKSGNDLFIWEYYKNKLYKIYEIDSVSAVHSGSEESGNEQPYGVETLIKYTDFAFFDETDTSYSYGASYSINKDTEDIVFFTKNSQLFVKKHNGGLIQLESSIHQYMGGIFFAFNNSILQLPPGSQESYATEYTLSDTGNKFTKKTISVASYSAQKFSETGNYCNFSSSTFIATNSVGTGDYDSLEFSEYYISPLDETTTISELTPPFEYFTDFSMFCEDEFVYLTIVDGNNISYIFKYESLKEGFDQIISTSEYRINKITSKDSSSIIFSGYRISDQENVIGEISPSGQIQIISSDFLNKNIISLEKL